MKQDSSSNSVKDDFSKIVKKAYELGINDKEITVQKIIEDLKQDLRQII